MNRSRLFTLVATALLVGCQSDIATDPGEISALISDGAHGGNSHFFFLPPMVESPTIPGSETFNPALQPELIACEFDEADPRAADPDPTIVCDGRVFPESGRFSAALAVGLYVYHWDTDAEEFGGPGSLQVDGKLYRVIVFVDDKPVGFADVDVEATEEALKEVPAGRVPLKLDRTLPVKFFIGVGVICESRGLNDENCGEGFADLTAGSGADAIYLKDNGVQIPDGMTFQVGAFTVLVTPCTDEDGNATDLPIDNPRFGPCLDFETFPKLTQPFAEKATVFICGEELTPVLTRDFTDPVDEPLAYDAQENFVTIHHYDENATGETPDVEALPHAWVDCDNITAMAAGEPNRLVQFAKAGWNAIRDAVAPEPLHARKMRRGHWGPGGLLGGFSQFQGALPAEMATVPETDNQVADAGSDITVQVQLSDIDMGDVWGARVRCTATVGGGSVSAQTPRSGDDGIQAFTWTLGDPGDQELECSGFGIGGDPIPPATVRTGPFMAPYFDAYGNPLSQEDALLQSPVALELGKVTFHAFACNNFTMVMDGNLLEEEWDTAPSREFVANLSKGSSAPATVKVMNDCTNLYIALTVERPEADDVNVLRVDVADGDVSPEAGDDVLKLEALAGIPQAFSDGFLTANCFRGGKQAECFEHDEDVDGSTDGEGVHHFADGLSVYEFRQPLNSGDTRASDGLSIDIARAFGDHVGLFFTLSQSPSAKGAQGNTQWPGFRVYLDCTVTIPDADGSTMTCVDPTL
jgi:hypothetical protein